MEPDYILVGDPGSKGAVVRINPDRSILVCRLTGKARHEWAYAIKNDLQIRDDDFIKTGMESLHAFASDHKTSLATMMANAGYMQALLDGFSFDGKTEMFDCAKWQYFHRVRGIPKNEKHKVYQQKATELFKIKYPQDAATAILMSDWLWWKQWGYK